MKQVFNTSVGTIEVLVDRESRVISVYRFDEQHRAVAAAIESWDYVDLFEVLNRQAGVPLTEANRIAATVREQHMSLGSLAERLEQRPRERGWSSMENAGIPLRFIAVLLDAVIVLFPLSIVIGLMSGGYTERSSGYANAGVNIGGHVFWLLLAVAVGYYVICEALANAAKHARATAATVAVMRVDGRAIVEVTDDGVGGADTVKGSGLRGLADRVEALDGALELDSKPAGGTRLRAEIPLG